MLYVSGDTHADFSRFSTGRFPEQKDMTKDDVVLILGDFGGVWEDSPEERYWLDWLNDKPFTTCYVDGNHECYDRYYSDEFEVVDFHGGKAHKIRDSVYHLMRGYVFDFEGKKFFCMGGASSHDIEDGVLDMADFATEKEFKDTYARMVKQQKAFRVNHLSWWKEELPSQEEKDFGEETLKKCNYKVDYVITHCLPQEIASTAGYHGSDSLTRYFDKLLFDGLKFDSWFCGHYHTNRVYDEKYRVLYDEIQRII